MVKKLKSDELIVQGIVITNPDKILFPKAKISKKEMILYYEKVATRMLPYLDKRLISTVRAPEGIAGEKFFKKHLGSYDKGMKKIILPNDSDNKEDYYYITAASGIISEAQMNAIEFHIWGSKINALEKPDMLVFDFDPDVGLNLDKVREGVKDLKKILDDLSLKSYLKTSGGKGYHVVVPLKPNSRWKKCRDFSKNIAQLMEEKWPDKYASNVRKVNRKGKIFIDWIRNTKGSTSAAPYSLRAKDKAAVSFPIKWSELEKFAPDEITIPKALARLKLKDPWEGFFNTTNSLN